MEEALILAAELVLHLELVPEAVEEVEPLVGYLMAEKKQIMLVMVVPEAVVSVADTEIHVLVMEELVVLMEVAVTEVIH